MPNVVWCIRPGQSDLDLYIRLCTVMAGDRIDIKRIQYGLQNQAGCLPPMIAARTESHIKDRVWNRSLITYRRLPRRDAYADGMSAKNLYQGRT